MGIESTKKKPAIFCCSASGLFGQYQLAEHQPTVPGLCRPILLRPMGHELVGPVIGERSSQQCLRPHGAVPALSFQQTAEPVADTPQHRRGLIRMLWGRIRMLFVQNDSCMANLKLDYCPLEFLTR